MQAFKFLLVLTLLTNVVIGKAQGDPQGEGIVTVALLYKFQNDTAGGKLFRSYRYFIKGNMILRKDPIRDSTAPTKQKVYENGQTTQIGSLTIRSTFSASWVHPVYLIDLEKQQAFTFFKKDSQVFVSLDTLDKHFEEFFYKPINKRSFSYRYLPDYPAQLIAGKTCYTAYWIEKGDTGLFRYTKEPTNIKSPINMYLPDFPYPILSLDGKSTKKTGEFEAYITWVVTELKEVKISDAVFRIPQDVVIMENVPLAEMIHGINSFSKENKNYHDEFLNQMSKK